MKPAAAYTKDVSRTKSSVVYRLVPASCKLDRRRAAATPDQRRMYTQMLQFDGGREIDTVLRSAVATGIAPGVVVAVTDRDETIYSGAFGVQDLASGVPMSPQTIFRIASMTKVVTSLAVMMLCDEGAIRLDDPVIGDGLTRSDRVITRFSTADKTPLTQTAQAQVAIRHLLTHTAGLAYEFTSYRIRRLQEEAGIEPLDAPLLFEPGADWRYSPATTVLGNIIKRAAGASLEDVFQAKILHPLGMFDTSFDLVEDKQPRLATVYRRDSDGFSEAELSRAFRRKEDGATGLLSTAEDYLRLIRLFLNDGVKSDGARLLSAATIRMMTINQIGDLVTRLMPAVKPEKAAAFPIGGGTDKFGFGFQVTASQSAAARSVGSCSWGGSRNTHFWFDPREGLGVVMLAQVTPYYEPAIIGLLQHVEQAIYKHL